MNLPKISKILTFLLITTFPSAFAQQKVITGIVLDEQKVEPLPYVNIGIANKSVGTVSSEKGKFDLKLGPGIEEQDTIVFSYIGFETKKLALSELSALGNELMLKPAENHLEEVVLETKKLKEKRLGRTTKGMGMMYYNFYTVHEKDVDDRLSKELGMNLKLRKNCRLYKFNFAIGMNEFKKLKFRINIYDIKENTPDSLLISDNIFFEVTDEGTGWQSVDLDPYNIYLKENLEEILITIQWVESVKAEPDSKFFSVHASKSPFHKVYFRNKAMDDWKTQTGSLSMYVDARCSE